MSSSSRKRIRKIPGAADNRSPSALACADGWLVCRGRPLCLPFVIGTRRMAPIKSSASSQKIFFLFLRLAQEQFVRSLVEVDIGSFEEDSDGVSMDLTAFGQSVLPRTYRGLTLSHRPSRSWRHSCRRSVIQPPEPERRPGSSPPVDLIDSRSVRLPLDFASIRIRYGPWVESPRPPVGSGPE